MRNVLMLMCGVVMMSCVVFAEDTTTETCANGAGTVVTGSVTGYKYCKSNKKMNWWNANSWCDGLGMRLFDLKEDCACSATVSDCAGGKCPELNEVSSDHQAWMVTPGCVNGSYFYGFPTRSARCNPANRGDNAGGYALCK